MQSIYLSITQCARGWPLSDSLKLVHKIRKYSLGRVRFVSGNYLLKENGIITFRSCVRIMSEKYVRLILGNYIIKLCKLDQKIT